MGMLRISGKLNLGQFWPKGAVGRNLGSDADTVKVVVDKVLFNGTPSSALNSAYVIDKGKKKLAVNSKGEINVRLQAVDAPELHYPTTVGQSVRAKSNGDFRQAWGQTAAKELGKFLKRKFGGGPLRCEVVSQNIAKPQDICDSHGRVVGNVVVNNIDINLWLLDEGWSFPTLYDGMLNDEIEEAVARAKRARDAGKGAWGSYESLAFFNPGMTFSRTDTGTSDKGKVILPKLFRRSSTSYVTHGSLNQLIADIRKSAKDRFVRTGEFIDGKRNFAQWGNAQSGVVGATAGGKVKLTVWPWDFVLKEEPSRLYRDIAGKRKEVTSF
jgi:endonuclease YncB( thermonuclease family)